MAVYVLPTEEGLPHRALLMDPAVEVPVAAVYNEEEEVWQIDGNSVTDDMSELITEHARSLGVDI
jgi:hypothetical protein